MHARTFAIARSNIEKNKKKKRGGARNVNIRNTKTRRRRAERFETRRIDLRRPFNYSSSSESISCGVRAKFAKWRKRGGRNGSYADCLSRITSVGPRRIVIASDKNAVTCLMSFSMLGRRRAMPWTRGSLYIRLGFCRHAKSHLRCSFSLLFFFCFFFFFLFFTFPTCFSVCCRNMDALILARS